MVGQPRLTSRGFVYIPDAGDLLSRAEDVVRSSMQAKRGTPPGKLEESVERALSSFFYRETKRKPVVTVELVQV